MPSADNSRCLHGQARFGTSYYTLKRVERLPAGWFILQMAKRDAPSTKRILARNLRRLRLERELSQDNLAAEAGLRQALISAIEIGTANPTLDSLERLATALKIDFATLFDRATR